MFTVGLGLLGATMIIMLFQNTSSAILIGFGFGGSLLALFLRVGGGIFTKAADVGADLVGKVEAGIPEDDPRNPATIADNVGDNVGDCAGMAADLFESYEVTLVASIILGVAAFNSIGMNPALGLMFPLAARAIGVVASIVGIFSVRAKPGETNALKPINRGFLVAGVLTAHRHADRGARYVGNDNDNAGWKCFGAVAIGLVLAQVRQPPHRVLHGHPPRPRAGDRRVGRDRPGHRRAGRHGVGPASPRSTPSSPSPSPSAWRWRSATATCSSRSTWSPCAGMGMLATTGVIVSEDTFGPVSDNAAGIAEMSGEFHGEPERIMVSLDAVGNTTKAVTKGFAIGSAVIAAVALFASFIETAGSRLLGVVAENLEGRRVPARSELADQRRRTEGLHRPADRWRRAVPVLGARHPRRRPHRRRRRAGGPQPVRRRQDHERREAARLRPGHRHLHRGLAARAGHAGPARRADPGRHRLRHRLQALGGFLAAVILVGQLMANYLATPAARGTTPRSTSRTATTAARARDAHKAAVIGDTVGDPFKDTAGPALNPLIKVMNLVSLLMLPAIINLQDNDGARFSIAGGALVVLIAAVVFSARQPASITGARVVRRTPCQSSA